MGRENMANEKCEGMKNERRIVEEIVQGVASWRDIPLTKENWKVVMKVAKNNAEANKKI